ncbi:hypothetical protein BU16DRAFT_613242 [Lophium mytilinum]|uniref:Ras modification protein ERF4 n=1 Tax=Lophium mytilinum TaxID=390894 RepID=A0A6A6RC48_9PEZI|nr:hypothetical protein BU16DRAFT_613242 [Lophium mytilinum]
MPLFVKTATSLIGLGTEAYAHHKEKKERANSGVSNSQSPASSQQQLTGYTQSGSHLSPTSSNSLAPPAYSRYRSNSSGSIRSNVSSYDSDEDEWARDAAQEQLLPRESITDNRTVDQIVDDFTGAHPPPTVSVAGSLPFPVIIPQKRPEARTHGFIRVYAPALFHSGIDEPTFLEFLDNYTASIKGSGYFNAVNVAIAASVIAYTVSAVSVNPAVHFAAFCVHASIEAGRRVQNVAQINKYLIRMNEELFKPHGLYAMLMTFKPTSEESNVDIDINANILKSVYARNGGGRKKIRSTSGKTVGEAQMPECCPLVFPTLDAPSTTEEQKKGAFKRAGAFVSDYKDRKARAQFQYNNPDSTLNVLPEEKFASIFSDPNHPMHKGGPLNTLTGGYLYKGKQMLNDKGMGSALPLKMKIQGGHDGGGVGGTRGRAMKRVIGEDVLYLMVVNMPSDEELAEVASMEMQMREAQQAQHVWDQQQQQGVYREPAQQGVAYPPPPQGY